MTTLRKKTRIVIFLLFCLIISGCWDRRELENLRIISATGFDLTEKEGYRISVQTVVSPPGGDQSSGQKTKVVVQTATGISPLNAIRNLTLASARRFFWADNKVLILGESLGQNGIKPVIDFWIRDTETRLRTLLLIADGEAKDFIEDESKTESIAANKLVDIIKNRQLTSTLPEVYLKDFIIQSNSPSKVVLVPKITFTSAKHQLEVKGKEKVLTIEGAGVFKGGKLIGWLNEEETRGREWVQKNVKGGVITVFLPEEEGEFATLEILRADSKVKVDLINDKPSITVEVKAYTYLNEQSTLKDLSKPEQLEKINKLSENVIRQEIETSLVKAKELNADYFGFATSIYQKHPKVWQEIEEVWDSIFPQIPVKIEVKSLIKRTGAIHGPTLQN